MAFAEDLLERAAFLARREPTRPKQASLRRAISTAYYAIYDGSIRWTRTDAKAKIAAVAAAFDRWETVRESTLAHALLLSLFLRERR